MTSGDLTGRKVMNRYKVVERIGGGGMAVVWKAYDLVLDRNVALKVLRPEMSEDDDFIRRFRLEAQSAASLSHNNIVSIYDVGEEQGLYFIVMELVEGQSLRDRLNAEGTLCPEEALRIAAGICEGLAHAHARRIIHRDIKPQNILLTKQGAVKVADFGIARALGVSSTTARDVVVGSAPYMAPEQARNGVASVRSDLYSVGVVLYEMLTGKPPFTGDSPVSVALQHVQAEVPPLRLRNPNVPQAVEDLVEKALSKDPLGRFGSAGEMLQAIGSLQSPGQPRRVERMEQADVVYKPPSPGGDEKLARSKKKTERVPTPVRVFLVFALLALAVLGYSAYLFKQWMAVPTLVVPDLVGRTQMEAQSMAKQAGFVFQISGERYDEEVPAGVVVSQSPQGGQEAKKGREVLCLISKGQDYVRVPDVTGKLRREAYVELQNAGVQVGTVDYQFHPTIDEDHVVNQNPKAGADVARDYFVDLVISKGQEPMDTMVPDIMGMTRAQAEDRLAEQLLDLGGVAVIVDPSVPEGTVISQSPPAGTVVAPRSKVTIVVSGKEVPAKTNNHTMSLTVPRNIGPATEPVKVKVVFTDATGENVAFDGSMLPGENREVSFRWKGSSAEVRITIGNDTTIKTIRP